MINEKVEVRSNWLTISWFVMAAVMVYKAVTDPADPSSAGYPLGQNHPMDLVRELIVSLAELGFLNAVLQPWSRRSRKRTSVALGVLFPWMIAYALFFMHDGSVTFAHVAWLLFLHGVLFLRLLAATYESATAHSRHAIDAESEEWIPWYPQPNPNDAIPRVSKHREA